MILSFIFSETNSRATSTQGKIVRHFFTLFRTSPELLEPPKRQISGNNFRIIIQILFSWNFPREHKVFCWFPSSPNSSKTQILLILSFRRLWNYRTFSAKCSPPPVHPEGVRSCSCQRTFQNLSPRTFPLKIKGFGEHPSLPLTQKHPKLRQWSEFSLPRKLRPWSELRLSLVNTESWGVWVLVRVFLGSWSGFPPARSETRGWG